MKKSIQKLAAKTILDSNAVKGGADFRGRIKRVRIRERTSGTEFN